MLVLVLFEALACSSAWPDGIVVTIDTAGGEILWLPERAAVQRDLCRPIAIKNRRSIYMDGSAAIVFSIESGREELSDAIVSHFANVDWHPRSTQDLNPGLPTSFERGWETTGGGGLVPLGPEGEAVRAKPYYQWNGEWENARGDIVRYMLGGQGRQLRGYADYAPRSVVESARSKLGY